MTRIALPLLAAALVAACSNQAEEKAPAAAETTVASETPAPAASSAEPSPAASNGRISRYTSLKDCSVVDDGGGEDHSVSRCKGIGPWSLQIDYGDARDDLRLIQEGEGEFKLDLIGLGSGGFNALGDAVEWRGTGEGANFAPSALIVRNNISDNPEYVERQTSILYVIDLAKHCAVARVRPGPRQNEEARAIADGAARACLE